MSIIAICSGIQAQDYGKNQTQELTVKQVEVNNLKEIIGTFRVDYQSGDTPKLLLTDDILSTIQFARKENTDVVLSVNPGVSVFIPSKKEVSNPTFIPFK